MRRPLIFYSFFHGLRTFEQVDALEAVLGEWARKKGEAPVTFAAKKVCFKVFQRWC